MTGKLAMLAKEVLESVSLKDIPSILHLLNEDQQARLYLEAYINTSLASGFYIYRLSARQAGMQAKGFVDIRRMIVTK